MKKLIIEGRKELFCTVTESDLKYDTLLHMMQAKGLDGWKFVRAIENATIPKTITKIEYRNDLTVAVREVTRFLSNPDTKKSALSAEQKKEISTIILRIANSKYRQPEPKRPKRKKYQNE
jgi:hypothetical protein